MISSTPTTDNTNKPKKSISEMDDDELLKYGEQIELTEEDLKELGSDIEDDEELKPYIKIKREQKSNNKTRNKGSTTEENAKDTTTSNSDISDTTSSSNPEKVLPPNPSFIPTLFHPVNITARNKFFVTTIAMFTLPLIAFYYSYHYLLNGVIVEYSAHNRLIYGAVAAVVTVQIVIGAFMYSSLSEPEPVETEEEKKKRENELKLVRNVLLSKGDLSEFSTKAILERMKKKKEASQQESTEKTKTE
ncbi:hypothetical protein C9374_007744 [Naegleria lovaniensis]|uniref:Uncharacterized protein n=1 Tax=Naegleria lovaniensis TaxID=51637 RepID=A0AA88KID0_NAELO|nr:uncharacterized protein C9374_007744 [Naegleria lovaniensis]KAG2379106.1 hypothetical protein C9374_007744 [Naegleria lovaniensis]